MQQSIGQRNVAGPAFLGLLLIAFGGAILILRAIGIDAVDAARGWGWPLFIIVPGLALLAASLVPARPAGVGFAIAGAIVTTVGLILLYQWRSGDWESWTYAWALIPAAAGLALVTYGAFAGRRNMVVGGLWMLGIAATLFIAGGWFFLGIFAGEPRWESVDMWPIGLIVIGAIVVVGALLRGDRTSGDPAPRS